MKRSSLWGIILLLVLTNLVTLRLWSERADPVSGESVEQISMEVGSGIDEKLKENEPAAVIGSRTIRYREWLAALEQKQGKKVLKEMIDKEVVSQLARQQGVKLNEKLIKRELALMSTIAGAVEQEEVKQQEKKWRENILHRLSLEEILTKNIEIDESNIQKHYETYGKDYNFTAAIQLSHLVVKDQKTASQVYAELEKGIPFAALARDYSILDTADKDGGYLGYFSEMSTYLMDDYKGVIRDMAVGMYSEPFPANDGIAILYLHRRLPSINFTYEEIKPHIKRELALKNIEQTISAGMLWEQAKVDWVYKN